MPRRLVLPERWTDTMTGSTLAMHRSASVCDAPLPFAAASAVLARLPSRLPSRFRLASAVLVRSEISRRSFSAGEQAWQSLG
jgi:hypothetical protein